MNAKHYCRFIALSGSLLAITPVSRAVAQVEHSHAHGAPTAIPSSIRAEHAAILIVLGEATKAAGRVAGAARAVADALYPHFVREEQVALPPLGALALLARGEMPENAASLLAMSDTLKAELPKMLEEHKTIRSAVQALGSVARAAGAEKYVQLAEQLGQHALTEEEVLYPAAVLVGDRIRAESQGGHCKKHSSTKGGQE